MASSSERKGGVKATQWWKHLRKYASRATNKKSRVDGKKRIDKELS